MARDGYTAHLCLEMEGGAMRSRRWTRRGSTFEDKTNRAGHKVVVSATTASIVSTFAGFPVSHSA